MPYTNPILCYRSERLAIEKRDYNLVREFAKRQAQCGNTDRAAFLNQRADELEANEGLAYDEWRDNQDVNLYEQAEAGVW